jgi:uncharacterized protein YdaL
MVKVIAALLFVLGAAALVPGTCLPLVSAAAAANVKSAKQTLPGPLAATPSTPHSALSDPLSILVLYDAPPNDQWTKLGHAYAIMLGNLLGHFPATQIDLLPVQNYAPDKLENYAATFYLGGYYNNALPAAFLADVMKTERTVVWFKYNLWQLDWDPQYAFSNRYGLSFVQLRGMNAAPTAATPEPGFFDTVLYKGKAMQKYYAWDESTGRIDADPDLGEIAIVDPGKAVTVVPIANSATSEELPYIVRSGNFWYVADMPLSYIGPRDRYLVLCDVLYDMLGAEPVTTEHRALVRLEDVSAITSEMNMKQLTDELHARGIPFTIATIPRYRDPSGIYNGGVPMDVPLSQAGTLRAALDYALTRGGKVVMHGFTHQYGDIANPHTGVSGDDFEFWHSVENRPVDEDSVAWAAGRLSAGLAELQGSGYIPIAWEAPHYQSSPKSMVPVPAYFATTYQRAVYYTSMDPTLNTTAPNKDFAVGQFFPYIIRADHHGQRVIPENLGNIEYDISDIDPTSYFDYTAEDLCLNAEYAKVVRGSFASFFFHPFWLEPSLGKPGLADFKQVLDCITAAGFVWADAENIE